MHRDVYINTTMDNPVLLPRLCGHSCAPKKRPRRGLPGDGIPYYRDLNNYLYYFWEDPYYNYSIMAPKPYSKY